MKMKNHILFPLIVFLLSLLTAGCGMNNDPGALTGTWTLYSGEVEYIAPPPIPGRQVTFKVHDGSVLKSFNSNGHETSVSIQGKEHRLVFKPNGEYIIYSGGIAIEKEGIVTGLPIYESGTYNANEACLALSPVTFNGTKPGKIEVFLRGSCCKKGGALDYKIENDSLSVIWKSFYFQNDPTSKKPDLLRVEGKMNFVKISDKILLPSAIPQNANNPDEFTSPKDTFFVLVPPNTKDNPIFIPIESTSEVIIAQDPLLDEKLISHQRSYIISGLSTPEKPENANLSLHFISRVTPEEYLQFKDAELERLGFTQTEYEYSIDPDKWVPRAYVKQLPKETIYIYEAVRERKTSEGNPVPKLYIVRMKLYLPIEEGNNKEASLSIHRKWNFHLQFFLSHYLSEDAHFPEDD